MEAERDWTQGPARWFAVGIIAGLSVAAVGWSFVQSVAGREDASALAASPPPPRHAALAPQYEAAALPKHALPDAAADETAPGSALHATLEPVEIDDDPADEPAEAPVPEPEQVAPATTDPPPPELPPPMPRLTRIMNLNTANAAELELLPGVGPALAGRIVEYREQHGSFRTVDELVNVHGIGPKTLEALRPRVRVH